MLCAAVAVVFSTRALWLSALGGFLVNAQQPRPADSVIVLAGDSFGNRILEGGSLVRAGYAPRALISGPYGFYGTHESDLAIPFAVAHGYPRSYFVALPNNSRSTREEADAVLRFVRKNGWKRLDIVTSNYHTRRAGRIYRALAPGIQITMVASRDEFFQPGNWWQSREGRKTFLLEWLKTVTGWFGL